MFERKQTKVCHITIIVPGLAEEIASASARIVFKVKSKRYLSNQGNLAVRSAKLLCKQKQSIRKLRKLAVGAPIETILRSASHRPFLHQSLDL